jgi:hypothetical protein
MSKVEQIKYAISCRVGDEREGGGREEGEGRREKGGGRCSARSDCVTWISGGQKTRHTRQETGDRRQETGDRRQETGDRSHEARDTGQTLNEHIP